MAFQPVFSILSAFRELGAAFLVFFSGWVFFFSFLAMTTKINSLPVKNYLKVVAPALNKTNLMYYI
jgi:hypothetical protein